MRSLRLIFPAVFFLLFFAGTQDQSYKKLCFDNNGAPGGPCVQAQVVDSPAAKQQGLMFRDSLGETEGMLFVYAQEGMYSFWMKNMRFPLDIIWIGADLRIVDMAKNALPCKKEPCFSFAPDRKALYVLEVPAGFTDRHNIEEGQKMSLLP